MGEQSGAFDSGAQLVVPHTKSQSSAAFGCGLSSSGQPPHSAAKRQMFCSSVCVAIRSAGGGFVLRVRTIALASTRPDATPSGGGAEDEATPIP